MKSKRTEKYRKNSGNAGLQSQRIPSRAAYGYAEGVETRRGCGIAHRNTPLASGTGNGEEIVQCSEVMYAWRSTEAPRSALAFPALNKRP